jgi:hypothetical protein
MNTNPDFNILSRFLFKGDVQKEDKALFLFIRIIHSVALLSVVIGLIICIILSITGHNTNARISTIFISCYIATLTVFGGIFAIWLVKKIFYVYKSKTFITMFHCLKIIFFSFPSIMPLLNQNDMPLIETLPLYIISAIALALSYPTKRRWEKWTKNCP